MQKKLLLVIPPQKGLLKGFATGIVSLAEYLALKQDEVKCEVEILDYSLFGQEELEISCIEYANQRDLVVGITTTTASYQSALRVARIFKDQNSTCTVVFGGHHASTDSENILKNHWEVDFVITGEGEVALFEFMRDFPHIENSSNLVYLKNGKLKRNPIAPLLSAEELDQISLSYKEAELYGHPGKFDTITYVSARGCPLKCSFCAVANQKMRAKSVPQVSNDIRKLVQLGFDAIAIEDNFFAHSPARTTEICQELEVLQKEVRPFKWDCQTRLESLKNPEIIRRMERAGCYATYLGVEALNDDHLMYLGKTKNPERYLELLFETVLPNILESTVDCYINIQLGIPGSNEQHHIQNMDSIRRIGSMAEAKGKRVTIFPMLHVVYPGTQHFSNGLFTRTFTADVFEYFTKWESTQTALSSWLGNNFAHGNGGIPQGILDEVELKKNSFELVFPKLLEIQNQLTDIKHIDGIKVFEYKPFIT